MHLVEFSLLSWKKKKRLLKRISLNATSKKNGRHKQSAFLKSE